MKFKFVTLLALTVLFSACKNSTETETIIETTEIENAKLSFEERINAHLRSSLAIPGLEKLNYKVYRAHLNNDSQEDAIITLNRYAFAEQELKTKKTHEMLKSLGYIGNYNYFVFYDGDKNKFSSPVPVHSSAAKPLVVKFENINSEAYKTLTVQYQINNAAFQNFYFIEGAVMNKVFQMKVYDYIGTSTPEAFAFVYTKGSISGAKNINVYKAKITNYQLPIANIFAYEPTIEATDELERLWFYSPKDLGYMTYDPTFNK